MANKDDNHHECNFCGKDKEDVEKLIVGGSDIAICNECVDLCVDILKDDKIKDCLQIMSNY